MTWRDPRFSNRDDSPETVGAVSDEQGAAFRWRQNRDEVERRLFSAQVQAANHEKQERLRARLEAGELDTADDARRWYYGLQRGERHGERELAEIDARAYVIQPGEEYDPNAVLAWLETHKEPASRNMTGAEALARLAELDLGGIRHEPGWPAS